LPKLWRPSNVCAGKFSARAFADEHHAVKEYLKSLAPSVIVTLVVGFVLMLAGANAEDAGYPGRMDLYALIIVGVIVYLYPSYVAIGRNHENVILAFNALLGWTVLGWIAALVWALKSEKLPVDISAKPS
jgi:hypothetical protein